MTYDYIARYVIEREKKKNITNCSLKKLKESKDINDLNKQWRLERISSRHKIDSPPTTAIHQRYDRY